MLETTIYRAILRRCGTPGLVLSAQMQAIVLGCLFPLLFLLFLLFSLFILSAERRPSSVTLC